MERPLGDRLELLSPSLTRLATRATLALPAMPRGAVLRGAFARAQEAFNRGDLEVVFAAFSPEVVYQPPPPLGDAATIDGRDAVLEYWRGIFERFDSNTIENLEVVETSRGTIRRTARLRHLDTRSGETLEYEILQTIELRGGLVVRQLNETV